MNLLLEFNIIIPLLLTVVKLSAGADNRKNGNNVCHLDGILTETVKFVVTEANGHEKEFHLRVKYINQGSFGKVFHAHPVNWDEFVQNQAVDVSDGQRHCVALKVAINEVEEQWTQSPKDDALGNEIKILRQFSKLANEEQRRHLVKLYYEGHLFSLSEGQIAPNRSKAYAMELGEISLSNHLHGNAGKLTNEQITEVAKDIALAMRDFHRVAMHLDLKPGNMVYFREPNGAMVLKAIDFGSCEILDRNDGPENRANFSKNEVILPVGTPYYSSPELKYDIELVLSPKADIWSIGIMIYETILWNLHLTDLKFFYDLMGKKLAPTEIIGELNNLYKYNKEEWIAERIKTIGTNENRLYALDQHDLYRSQVEYAAYVSLVYKVRSKHMRLYELINACLQLDPIDRPSAVGILEYLEVNSNCKLHYINEQNPKIILDDETVKTIRDHLKAKNRKLSHLPQRVLSKIPFTKEKAKRKLQRKEVHRIAEFPTWSGQNLDLRTPVINKVDPHPHRQNPPVKLCDRKTSELPLFKMEAAERPSTSETVHNQDEISAIHEYEH